jgi:hypothetical protein
MSMDMLASDPGKGLKALIKRKKKKKKKKVG